MTPPKPSEPKPSEPKPAEPKPRVTVTHPLTRVGGEGTTPKVDVRAARGGDSAAEAVALRSIMRAQFQLTVKWFGSLVGLLFGIATVLAIAPSLGKVQLVGVPVTWMLLGFGLFPVLTLMARRFVRSAEYLERRFLSLTESLRDRQP
jgi:hypothetical protein